MGNTKVEDDTPIARGKPRWDAQEPRGDVNTVETTKRAGKKNRRIREKEKEREGNRKYQKTAERKKLREHH